MTIKSFVLWILNRPHLGAWLGRLLAFLRGKSTVAGLINPMFVSHYVIERNGAALLADRSSYLARQSPHEQRVEFQLPSFEPELDFLVRRLVRDSDIVLDIGANIGVHTVAFARLACRGHVYAFEPVAEMAERLSINCALNGLDNVTVIRCALGAESTEQEMNVNVCSRGLEGTSSFLRTDHVAAHPDQFVRRVVKVRRLDDVARELDLKGRRISFIKIDTEGAEPTVLEGGKDLIGRHRPALFVEAHSQRLAELGKSFLWYRESFPSHHVLMVMGISPANPYLRLVPLEGEPRSACVNLLLLPKAASGF